MKHHKKNTDPSTRPNRSRNVIAALSPLAVALILSACSSTTERGASLDEREAGYARSAIELAVPGTGSPEDSNGKIKDIETTLEKFSPKFVSHISGEVERLYDGGKFDGGVIEAGDPAFIFNKNKPATNNKGSLVAYVDTLTYGAALMDESGRLTGVNEDENIQRLSIYYKKNADGQRGEAFRVDYDQSNPASTESGVGSVSFEDDRISLHRYESQFRSEDSSADNDLGMTLFSKGHFVTTTPTSGEGIGHAVQDIENLLQEADLRVA